MTCSWIGKLNYITVLPKLIYGFDIIPVIIPQAFFFFWRIDKLILKVLWKCERLRISKTILKS